ncbi:MAG TPA: RING finger protein [Pyrinomonadaceae bacterium]|nr:RING finger protein [Pyrinomonadaceae bacterium]
MAAINYRFNDGPLNKVEFTREELRIGADSNLNHLVLPASAGVASQHAIITRAVVGKLPVLVSLAGYGLRVNRQTVVSLRVLHHGDRIEVGSAELELREIQIKKLPEGAQRVCAVCDGALKANDEVVSCPNCDRAHHRGCWFEGEHCSTFACEYPIHQTVIQALSPPVSFMTKLEKSHKLATNQKVCLATNCPERGFGVPFQQNDDVAFCPKCEAALHLRCWLASAKCPGCLYDIKHLIDMVFEGPSVQSIA